jgi:hypothetical protein
MFQLVHRWLYAQLLAIVCACPYRSLRRPGASMVLIVYRFAALVALVIQSGLRLPMKFSLEYIAQFLPK